MKKLLALLLLSVALSANAQDKKNNRPTSYNYMRGVESVQNEKTEEALEFFNKDIQENPKNGYSYSWIAMLTQLLRFILVFLANQRFVFLICFTVFYKF